MLKNSKKATALACGYTNTRIWKRYPHEKKNIEYIEKTLSEYLYDFPEKNPDYINVVDDKMF